jgi:hypothetical protein
MYLYKNLLDPLTFIIDHHCNLSEYNKLVLFFYTYIRMNMKWKKSLGFAQVSKLENSFGFHLMFLYSNSVSN